MNDFSPKRVKDMGLEQLIILLCDTFNADLFPLKIPRNFFLFLFSFTYNKYVFIDKFHKML